MQRRDGSVWCFEGFTLDLRRGCLRQGEHEIGLRSKSFAVLRHLVENAGRLIAKDELLEAIWPNVVASDESLARCISDVRLALSDTAQRIVRTVARRGYLFAVPVAEQAESSLGPPIPIAPPQRLEERRPMTVMSCQFVGLAAQSSRIDPEDLRAVTAACHRHCLLIVEQHRGQVAHHLGDHFLCYFGYPVAGEHDAENAVRAGLALVGSAASLAAICGTNLGMRIGVASGVVVVGEVLVASSSLGHIAIGETPNLAERLRDVAETDGVTIDDATRRLVGTFFDCRDLGRLALLGFPLPVHGWQVLGMGGVQSRFDALRPMRLPVIGRDEEIDLLLRRWQQAKLNHGSVVLISGEPGIGKSRIAQALQDRLEPEAHTHLCFFCSPHHQHSALYPTINQLSLAAGLRREDTAEQRLAKLEALLAPVTNTLDEVLPLLADLLSIPTGERPALPGLTPKKRRERTLQALLEQTETLAAQRPVLIVFEDLHWSDPTTLELLDLYIGTIATRRILMVLTYRPDFAPPWIGQSHVSLLSLNRLARAQCVVMVSKVAGGKALPRDIAEQIINRTDGIPLFVEELTKNVIESGIVIPAGDYFITQAPATTLPIPMSLHASLLARLDRLRSAREVAQIGAVIGREFSYQFLSAIARLSEADLTDGLDGLISSGLAYRRGVPPDAEYVFKHALIQEAAYDSLTREKRRILHGNAVRALEEELIELGESRPEVLARHCTEARLTAKAIANWLRAGERAIARSALVEAIAQLQEALKLIPSLPDDTERDRQEMMLQLALGGVLIAVSGYGAEIAGRAYARAHYLCTKIGHTQGAIRALWGQFVNFHVRAEVDRSHMAANELLNIAERENDDTGRLIGHRAIGDGLIHVGEFAAARAHLEQAVAVSNHMDHRSLALLLAESPRIASLQFLALASGILGFLESAHARNEQAVEEARGLSHVTSLAFALSTACRIYCIIGDSHVVLRCSEELLVLAREQSLAFFLATGSAYRGWALLEEGDWAAALEHLQYGIARFKETGAAFTLPLFLGWLAKAYSKMNQDEKAFAQLSSALAHSEATGVQYYDAELFRIKGDLLLANHTSNQDDAETQFRNAISLAKSQDAKLFQLRASIALARLWVCHGRRDQARDLLMPVYGWFTEGLDTPDLQDARDLVTGLRSNYN
jgi:predicted ATPase/class 3 adenylate cyclase